MAWARLAEPDDPVSRGLIERFGWCESLELVLRHGGGGRTEAAQRFSRRAQQLDVGRDLQITEMCKARVLIPGDDEWPVALDDLQLPPHCLWVRGRLPDLSPAGFVSVVGARAATNYGLHVASDFGAGLASRGMSVVSGGALGIDGAAHRGALATEGSTVAVLACGVDRDYPPAHATLLEQIRAQGAVLSEVPPGTPPTRFRFLSRNRLIAALGAATVVVEAALRSGALRTAHDALALHRPVGVVPGPVTSAASAGCHQFARSTGSTIVTDVEEVIELVSSVGEGIAPTKRGLDRPLDEMDDLAARVWESLPLRASRSADDLCRLAGLSDRDVVSALARLEVANLVERRLDGWGRTPV